MLYSGPAIASLLILAANVIPSLIGLFGAPKLIDRCLFRPYEFARGRNRSSLVTHAFMHADLAHLFFNMLTFWFFGFPLERTIGTPRFALLYALGLLISPLISYRKHRNDPNYATLGASGAVTAVLFAYIVYYPMSRIGIFPLPIPIPAPLYAVAYLAYSWWLGKQGQGRINHDAHFAGALTGLVFVLFTDPNAWNLALHFIFA